MHSHDRTLLSSLGFSDPDKKDRLHDLACQYLALREIREKLVGLLAVKPPFAIEVSGKSPIFEMPISKGEGQYKTTIGFVDLVLPFSLTEASGEKAYRANKWLGVEVKIAPVGVGDILRQIKLYRGYLADWEHWLVATSFPLSSLDVAMLRTSGILHVRLGEAFDAWAETQQEGERDEAESLTI